MHDSTAAILAERQQTHGDFGEHAQITQTIKEVMKDYQNWALLTWEERESLEMIAHKIGRILAGNPHFKDHWDDIAGYARLVADKLP